jgi:hypothetical protein
MGKYDDILAGLPQPVSAPTAGKYDQWTRDLPKPNEVDFGAVVMDALNEAKMGNGSKMRALMTDPITQAKVLPYLAQVAGGFSGIPGGTTAGMVGGRQLSNLALRTYGKPEEIPSTTHQVIEAGGSALADIIPVPWINKKIFGGQVGTVEKAAGVPAAQDIRSIPMTLGQKTVGEFINDAVDSVKSSGLEGTPAYWKQIKDQVDRIYKIGADQKLTNLDQGRLKWLNAMVQKGLNKAVPGRAVPAKALEISQTIPNYIERNIIGAIPPRIRSGLGWGVGVGTGAGGMGGLAYELGRKIMGGGQSR